MSKTNEPKAQLLAIPLTAGPGAFLPGSPINLIERVSLCCRQFSVIFLSVYLCVSESRQYRASTWYIRFHIL